MLKLKSNDPTRSLLIKVKSGNNRDNSNKTVTNRSVLCAFEDQFRQKSSERLTNNNNSTVFTKVFKTN